MEELLFKEEVYKIVGAAMEVHRVMGPGFLEAVYQEALAIEFKLRNIPFNEFPKLKIDFKGIILKKHYVPDFLCFDEIIVEIKALEQCTKNDESQIINSLKAAKKAVGVLINFGEPSLFYRRFVSTKNIKRPN
ncbi:MAG: GxxExxY protein [candidate division KSB1 bacterium]|nr:GxxExxY protein [candidate division KSB1 bacterium]